MSEWQPIETAPFDREIDVSVLDRDVYHPFAYPVRRQEDGWLVDGISGWIDINPTHWRERIDDG